MKAPTSKPAAEESALDVRNAETLEPADAAEIKAIPVKPIAVEQSNGGNALKALWQRFTSHKKVTIPLTILLLAGALVAIPQTRYPILGTCISKPYKVVVLDQSSQKPVSGAEVTLKGAKATTDAKGEATLRTKVGSGELKAAKKYYKTASGSVLVALSQKDRYRVLVVATGRQVPVAVVNKITGKPVPGAVLAAAGTETKTDKAGKATMVLPADKKTVAVIVKIAGHNDQKGNVVVTEQADKANTFTLTPAGKVYFLSRQTGKIDVVKTDLDGTNRQTVLAGTGKEETTDTILLASRDWKYLALKSKRDGGENAKVFLIDATNGDKLTTMDEGNANFTLVGWSNHRFVYQVNRNGVENWQAKSQALKSYDASAARLTVLDESTGEGTNNYDYVNSWFGTTSLIGDDVVYYKNWTTNNYYGQNKLQGKNSSLVAVKADGAGRRTIKDFPADPTGSYFALETRLYAPAELYIKVPPTGQGTYAYYEYEGGKVSPKSDVTDQSFYEPYPTYLESPSAKLTFWSDQRDGKNTLFVGNADGSDEKQIASLSEYTQYGWYTDEYLLVSKGGSELAILPKTGGTPFKVTDYHKPNYNFSGYGKGYGGL